MNDVAAAMIITGAVVLAALGAYYVVEVVTVHLAVRRSSTKPIAAWPCDTIAPCESWVGREITAPVIDEAARIAEYAWNVWEASPIRESNDD